MITMKKQQKDIQMLVEAGSIKGAVAQYEPLLGGWVVTFTTTKKTETHSIHAQRGDGVKVFKTLDAVNNTVKAVGLGEMVVKTV
jgi:hypothetical protein